ncbi:MAG: helix-turn-helix domain-containing protein [Rhodoferax sp.]|nr:helix-turn-helix domain-containing protein [Rhodoferax sp.]
MSILASAVSVLRCYSTSCSELTVTDVAHQLSLPKSNVSRLLRSMRSVGLLDSARDGRGYSPGIMLVGLGELAGAGHTLGVRAHAAVSRVSDQCGHAGFVSARVGRRMVGLTHHAGRNPLQVGVFMGGQPLYVDACATGRALLATLTDQAVRDVLDGQVSLATPQSPATVEELFARLVQVRQRGYAESHDEAGKGIGAVAVAVRDERTHEVLSFCITYPEATVDAAELRSITEALLQARSDIMRTPL